MKMRKIEDLGENSPVDEFRAGIRELETLIGGDQYGGFYAQGGTVLNVGYTSLYNIIQALTNHERADHEKE